MKNKDYRVRHKFSANYKGSTPLDQRIRSFLILKLDNKGKKVANIAIAIYERPLNRTGRSDVANTLKFQNEICQKS